MKDAALRARVLIIAAVLATAFTALTSRLAWLQIVRHDELAAMAERQYSRTIVLPGTRGPIVDRHGAPLATSSPAESLFAQPRAVADPVRVARRLTRLLGTEDAEMQAALTSARPWLWLKRRLPPAVAAEVRALREPGLGLVPEPLRLYPNRELAAHVIGFDGVDGGLEGVERAWNGELAGTPGKAIVGRDALGREVTAPQTLVAPAPGHGLMLTIDRTIQYLVEREIDAAWRRTGSRTAIVIVMEPRTADVLALAVRPTFNPNAFADAPSPDVWRDRAVTDPFEPGSTFKVILAAAALEEGVVTPEDRIFAENGSIVIAKTTIHDWKKYGWLTFAEVLQNSSNIGAIKVGLALGRDRYARYISAFGFGATTAAGLPGESRGVVRPPERWSALSLPTMSIGQEISVTAMQMIAAFGAVANGGTLMQPRLVKATFDAEGRELARFEPRPIRQVISPKTARTLTHLLGRVVESGTGHAAAIPGYDVAGKTGTAQKLDPATHRYSHAPGVLSFIGFVPADEPRLVMLVMLDEPKTEKWGSEAAAPIFAAIGAPVLRYLEVPSKDVAPIHIVTGGATLRVRATLTSASTAPGSLDEPAEPSTASEGLPEAVGMRRMPDLRGRTLRAALATLAPLGARVQVAGRGRVADQSPAAGEPLDDTAPVRLTLGPVATGVTTTEVSGWSAR